MGIAVLVDERPPYFSRRSSCPPERAAPGKLLQLDTKKLGRIDGVDHRITGDRALNRIQE